MRKIDFIIILTFTLVVSLIGCSSIRQTDEQAGVVIPKPRNKDVELTMIMNPAEYQNIKTNELFLDYVSQFEKSYGIKVKYELLGTSPGSLVEAEDKDAYMKELSPKLFAKDGPDLIYSEYMPLEPVIAQGAAVKLNDKVPNLTKLYPGLLRNEMYFALISIMYNPRTINLQALEGMGIEEPKLDWTSRERFEIRTKWLKSNRIYFNAYEWYMNFDAMIDLDGAYDESSNKFVMNTPQMKEDIKALRKYIFNGSYILNKNYKFDNYYSMIYEDNSEEFKEDLQLFIKNKELGHIEAGRWENPLRAIDVQAANLSNGAVLMPEFSDKDIMLSACGFVVSKNARNPELAFEFINGLLSNEMQMKLFEQNYNQYYPVNKEIEEEIKTIEEEKVKDIRVLEIKDYILDQLKNKQMKLWNADNWDFMLLKYKIEEDLSRIILADEELSQEELSAKLQELENRYNIWLNE